MLTIILSTPIMVLLLLPWQWMILELMLIGSIVILTPRQQQQWV